MSRFDAYLATGKRIIEQYNNKVPLSAWLKDFFRQHKQMGSRDRKMVSELVYSFYRLGHSTTEMGVEERILTALFFCKQLQFDLLHHFRPEWDEAMHLHVDEKLKYLPRGTGLALEKIFPWQHALSENIDTDLFNTSFLQQPDLFIRLRPGKESAVLEKLKEAGLSYDLLHESCISLPNASRVDDIIAIDKEAVIQDLNSQEVGKYLFNYLEGPNPNTLRVWDCCAASGGKSIMAHDLNPAIELTVSDVRKSILHNLEQRFASAGIKSYTSFIADLADDYEPSAMRYPLIIADLPCTGSGTWARTPEQLYFFNPKKIQYYSELQKKIIKNIVPQLQRGGTLVYITCSVFKDENEALVNFITKEFRLQLVKMELLTGYSMKADTMFVAVLRKD